MSPNRKTVGRAELRAAAHRRSTMFHRFNRIEELANAIMQAADEELYLDLSATARLIRKLAHRGLLALDEYDKTRGISPIPRRHEVADALPEGREAGNDDDVPRGAV